MALFHAFPMDKGQTMHMKGGNTDELHSNGRLEFAQSLQRQHPNVSVWQWYDRWHHVVDYRPFHHNPCRMGDWHATQAESACQRRDWRGAAR